MITLIRRVEDAEELGPQEGGPLGGEGLDPSPAPYTQMDDKRCRGMCVVSNSRPLGDG